MPALITGLFLLGMGVTSEAEESKTIELQQTNGERLILEAPARRIITLAPHLAELVFLAGAQHRLVGTVAWSDYPAEANKVPRIGDAFRMDLEAIHNLTPDLIIAWDSGNPEAALNAMQELGFKVWRTEIGSVAEMANLLRALGKATGSPDRAATEAAAVSARLQTLRQANSGKTTVRYFYQVAQQPLYTVSGDHLISQGLAICGGENVFDDLPTLAPQISPESVIQADPEVLFAGQSDAADENLKHWQRWERMSAVQTNALYYLPANLINRATPRMLDAVETACGLLDEYRSSRRSERLDDYTAENKPS